LKFSSSRSIPGSSSDIHGSVSQDLSSFNF